MINKPQIETRFKYVPQEAISKKCQILDSKFAYFIKTARNAAEERFRIRRQFRSAADQRLKNYFFVLGTDQSGVDFSNHSALEEERRYYDDIIVADFHGRYYFSINFLHIKFNKKPSFSIT